MMCFIVFMYLCRSLSGSMLHFGIINRLVSICVPLECLYYEICTRKEMKAADGLLSVDECVKAEEKGPREYISTSEQTT